MNTLLDNISHTPSLLSSFSTVFALLLFVLCLIAALKTHFDEPSIPLLEGNLTEALRDAGSIFGSIEGLVEFRDRWMDIRTEYDVWRNTMTKSTVSDVQLGRAHRRKKELVQALRKMRTAALRIYTHLEDKDRHAKLSKMDLSYFERSLRELEVGLETLRSIVPAFERNRRARPVFRVQHQPRIMSEPAKVVRPDTIPSEPTRQVLPLEVRPATTPPVRASTEQAFVTRVDTLVAKGSSFVLLGDSYRTDGESTEFPRVSATTITDVRYAEAGEHSKLHIGGQFGQSPFKEFEEAANQHPRVSGAVGAAGTAGSSYSAGRDQFTGNEINSQRDTIIGGTIHHTHNYSAAFWRASESVPLVKTQLRRVMT